MIQRNNLSVDDNIYIYIYIYILKYLDDQAMLSRPKTVDSEAVLQDIRANPVSDQASLVSHSPVWFVMFKISAKVSGAAE